VSCKQQFTDENAGASQQRAVTVSSSKPLLELVASPSGQSVPAWFQQAVTAANVILKTKEGETLLKDAIERWILSAVPRDPHVVHKLDAAEAVRRLFALHAQGLLRILVNYYKNAEENTFLSTSRQRRDASCSGKEPAMFVAEVAMNAQWRTRAFAVAGKSSSEAHLRFGFFVKLMHEIMHSVAMPILRALYFGEKGWDPAAEKLDALPTQQGSARERQAAAAACRPATVECLFHPLLRYFHALCFCSVSSSLLCVPSVCNGWMSSVYASAANPASRWSWRWACRELCSYSMMTKQMK
jgi:hypothetical protein